MNILLAINICCFFCHLVGYCWTGAIQDYNKQLLPRSTRDNCKICMLAFIFLKPFGVTDDVLFIINYGKPAVNPSLNLLSTICSSP